MKTTERGLSTPRWAAALTAFVGLGTGCDNVDSAVIVLGVATPETSMGGACRFSALGADYYLETVLNTFDVQNNIAVQVFSHGLAARLFNDMENRIIPIELTPPENLTIANQVSPVRFDYRWECESNGFTGDLGPLVLPQFNPRQPFCLDDRDETGDFIGFDAVPASGGTIRPRETGIVSMRPIPTQLGRAFDETFLLAKRAAECCEAVNGCDNVATAPFPMGGVCDQVDQLLGAISGGAFSARNPEDVRRWQPYSIYDGTTPSPGRNQTGLLGALYPLRLRGRFEMVTSSGQDLTSTELVHRVSICRGCSVPSSACTL